MKVSEFRLAVDDEFGAAHEHPPVRELVVDELGGRTADAAIAAGLPVAQVWTALCRANGVPPERRHGRGRPAAAS